MTAYLDENEFNKALDAAVKSISGSRLAVGWVIFVALALGLAFLYIDDWFIGWELRDRMAGFDLAKPLWIILILMMISGHAWNRSQHDRIIKQRLCLKCGTSLLAVDVDENGAGACPRCSREFQLDEYRRPSENRGAAFRGYQDAEHFDKTMYAASEHLRKSRGMGVEAELMGWCWLLLGLCFALAKLIGWDVLEWMPGSWPKYSLWFLVCLVWSGFYSVRVKKLLPTISAEKLCLTCGYSLLHTPLKDTGRGRCPECGTEFDLRQYERPPKEREGD